MNLAKDIVFTTPDWVTDAGDWALHIPFALWLMETCRPGIVVEDPGTTGDSYFAFCQAAAKLGLGTRCHAVDYSSLHPEVPGRNISKGVLDFNQEKYGSFSSILNASDGRVQSRFADRSVDILHLDGFNFPGQLGEVFKSWLPKLSDKAVLLLHNIMNPDMNSGVVRLWRELRSQYPGYSFSHGRGLGVMGIGPDQPGDLRDLLEGRPEFYPDEARRFFSFLGKGVSSRGRGLNRSNREVSSRLLHGSAGDEFGNKDPGEWVATAVGEGRTDLYFSLDPRDGGRIFCFNPAREPCVLKIGEAVAFSSGSGEKLEVVEDNADYREGGFFVFLHSSPEIVFSGLEGHYQKAVITVFYLDLGNNPIACLEGEGFTAESFSRLLKDYKDQAEALVQAREELRELRQQYQAMLQKLQEEKAENKFLKDRLWAVEHSTTWRFARYFLGPWDLLRRVPGGKSRLSPARPVLKTVKNEHNSEITVLVHLSDTGKKRELADQLLEFSFRGEIRLAASLEGNGVSGEGLRAFFMEALPGRPITVFDSSSRVLSEVFLEMSEPPVDLALFSLVMEYPGRDIGKTRKILGSILDSEVQKARKLMLENESVDIILARGSSGVEDIIFWARMGSFRKMLAAYNNGKDGTGATSPGPEWIDGALGKSCVVDTDSYQYQMLRHRTKRELEQILTSRTFLSFPRPNNPALSIVIVLFNQADLTFQCLKSIQESDFTDYELILVNNDSSDATGDLLYLADGARVFNHPENIGFLRAVNKAVEKARGEFILLLNNDAILDTNAISEAIACYRSSQHIGAVGGKLIHFNGCLQEAGSIVWSDGTCMGYGRGMNPESAEFQFRRDVDYCSGAFLLLRRDLFLDLGGFNEVYAPAYYEDTDFCLRLRKAGYRTVYEPRVRIRHWERASADSWEDSCKQMVKNSMVFLEKHHGFLQENQCPSGEENVLLARFVDRSRKRILVIDDRLALSENGAGSPRTAVLLDALTGIGCQVTFFAYNRESIQDWDLIWDRFPREIEFILDQGGHHLADFLRERKELYDLIWVSRPHNQEKLNEVMESVYSDKNWRPGIIYDAEAVYALRTIKEAEVRGEPLLENERNALMAEELELASQADVVVGVSEAEVKVFKRSFPHKPSYVLGYCTDLQNRSDRSFRRRRHLLFTGRLDWDGSPNVDSLRWFISEVFPLVRERAGRDIKFIVVGLIDERLFQGIDLEGVVFKGARKNLSPYNRNCRIFVAPTRYAAGIPIKLYEAAASRIPVVCTPILAGQLGWTHEKEVLVAGTAKNFASEICRLYQDEILWEQLRQLAYSRVVKECSRDDFENRVEDIISGIFLGKGKGERIYSANNLNSTTGRILFARKP